MTCGDIIAQFTVDKRKLSELDLKRTLRFTILGSCVVVSTNQSHFFFLNTLRNSKHCFCGRILRTVVCEVIFVFSIFQRTRGCCDKLQKW